MDSSQLTLREDGVTGYKVYTALPGASVSEVQNKAHVGSISNEDLYTNIDLYPSSFSSEDICFQVTNTSEQPEVLAVRTSREAKPMATAKSVGPHAHAVAPLYKERVYSFPYVPFSDLSYRRWENLLFAIQKRMISLEASRSVEYISVTSGTRPWTNVFERYGYFEIQTSPFTPFETENMLVRSKQYYQAHEISIWERIQEFEEGEQVRVVYDNDNALAICPYVSLFPYEVIVFPKGETAFFSALSSTIRSAIAQTMSKVAKTMAATLSDPTVTYIIHSAPVNGSTYPYFRTHIRMIPHVRVPYMSHAGDPHPVNPVSPQDAAKALRKHL
ncbi:MAG: hypothetical protein ABEI13_01540 [Candidatus Paceibacteria bacterium]